MIIIAVNIFIHYYGLPDDCDCIPEPTEARVTVVGSVSSATDELSLGFRV